MPLKPFVLDAALVQRVHHGILKLVSEPTTMYWQVLGQIHGGRRADACTCLQVEHCLGSYAEASTAAEIFDVAVLLTHSDKSQLNYDEAHYRDTPEKCAALDQLAFLDRTSALEVLEKFAEVESGRSSKFVGVRAWLPGMWQARLDVKACSMQDTATALRAVEDTKRQVHAAPAVGMQNMQAAQVHDVGAAQLHMLQYGVGSAVLPSLDSDFLLGCAPLSQTAFVKPSGGWTVLDCCCRCIHESWST